MSTSRTREKADGELFKSTGIDDNATSTAVTIDANENVGIGTSSPTGKLTVNSSASNEGVIRLGDHATYYGELSRINATDEVRLSSNGGSQNLTFHTANNERMRIDSSGRVLVGITGASGFASLESNDIAITGQCILARGSGSVLVGTTTAGSAGAGDIVVAGGVYLGGTGAANKLQDYETGTWTGVCTWASQGTGATINGGGTYTKIGDTVHAAVYLQAQKGNASGNFHIAGLPFAATDSVPVSLRTDGIGATSKVLMANTNNGNTNISFLLANQSTSYGSTPTTTNMVGTVYIQLQVTYRV